MDHAEIKYSTVQNWYPGDKEGKGGVFNLVTKRGMCESQAKISWTQVETGSAVTWKYPSCILKGALGNFSDADFFILDSDNNPNVKISYYDVFPVSLEGLDFDISTGRADFLQGIAAFKYRHYEITPL